MRTLSAFLFLAVFLSAAPSAQAEEAVVLLHGIGRSKSIMEELETDFAARGYRVLNIDYLSRQKSLEDLAEDVHEVIKTAKLPAQEKLHFVGHSMGGLLIRVYLARHRPQNLGRVVMIGTPNQGSEVADFLKDNALYKSFYGPAGQELVTGTSKIEELSMPIDYPLGIIAGDRSIDPVSSAVIPGPDDGKVSVESTKIEGMSEHIVLHATHTFMTGNETVIRQTACFLKDGKFCK